VPYTRAVKSKTAKSPKRPKPSSPTDHCAASKRKTNPEVTIKQEFIDGVDTTKGIAPIFGSTSRKSPEVRDALPRGNTTSSGKFDIESYSRLEQCSTTRNTERGYRRGIGRGRGRDKRDRVQYSRPIMILRSIGVGDYSAKTLTKLSTGGAGLKTDNAASDYAPPSAD